jgi:hypothetical protein
MWIGRNYMVSGNRVPGWIWNPDQILTHRFRLEVGEAYGFSGGEDRGEATAGELELAADVGFHVGR